MHFRERAKNVISMSKAHLQEAEKGKWFDLHPPVFYPGAALILLFIILTLTFDNKRTYKATGGEDPRIGAELAEVPKKTAKDLYIGQGVEIEQKGEGFFQDAPLEVGDIILSIDGKGVGDPSVAKETFRKAAREKGPQGDLDPVEVVYLKRGVGVNVEGLFMNVQNSISDNMGWMFILAVNIFMIFLLVIGFSKFGDIRLGGSDAKPEFSTLAWFSMLFSAGMGIGIIFWSVAEPMYHFASPPVGTGNTPEAASTALKYTFLHWGLHAWGIYALVGLALAFFAFNKGLPLSIRSVFYSVLGDRIYKWPGDLIDILAVLSTLFGLATSLGIGVKQINAGLDFLTGIGNNVPMQVLLITLITFIATISVFLGIDKGVKVLSEWNVRIGAVFLLFMFLVGPTAFIMDTFIQSTGAYTQNIFSLSTWTEAFQESTWKSDTEQSSWQNSWTVFYWSWWIAWSPFVGTFIARVSRGRKVREFVFGVLLVPSLITFFWLAAFGGSALNLELNQVGNIAEAVQEDVSVALFELLEEYPLFIFSSIVGIIMVTIFFVTSSDSGSLVVDSLTSGGKVDAPVGQRIFWALSEGAVAAVLLVGGGLNALQTAVITTGLPFALILMLLCYSLNQGLKHEYLNVFHEKKGTTPSSEAEKVSE